MPSSVLLSTHFTTSSCTPTSTFTNACTPCITLSSFKTRTKQAHGFRVSCNAEDNENQLILPETQKLILPNNVDRRNLLVRLGGLYTAANVATLPSALAIPIKTPDGMYSCMGATPESIIPKPVKVLERTLDCCPPCPGKTSEPFKFPSEEKTRMRWPAHKGTKKQVHSYKKAIQAIRNLPPNHPHSFVSQAKIHCAYCNGGYTQVDSGFPNIKIQIHNSWLFFPFHRWYLYFYERILRKYSGDDDFALPYWNWDNPKGMTIPQIFVDEKDDDKTPNPLYDEKRNECHLPPEVVDLYFRGRKLASTSADEQIDNNLCMVYRDMKTNAPNSVCFFGGKYTAGNDNPDSLSAGSMEGNSHTAVHVWVGQSRKYSNGEDMGSFYSSGYDPLFYVHHANVDRMWKLWKDLSIANSEPTDEDWLNASYVFYDENAELVRVCNKDSVNIDKLKYDFEPSDTPWENRRPVKKSKEGSEVISSALIGKEKTVEEAFGTGPGPALRVCKGLQKFHQFMRRPWTGPARHPAHVDPLLKVRVKRPATNRTPEQKKEKKEILCIKGIQFNSNKFVKFDVFVNDKVNEDTKTSELPTPCDPEFAGSFSQVPHGFNQGEMLMPSAARFGLDELLEDTKTEGLEYALVALVAKAGCEDLTVSGIEIKLE